MWKGHCSAIAVLRNCWRFLDACVRQNTAELPKMRVVQHLKFVRHTAQEWLGEVKSMELM